MKRTRDPWLNGSFAIACVGRLCYHDAPTTVRQALDSFALNYGGTLHELERSGLQLVDENGKPFDDDAILPCGLPAGADAFVRSSKAPVQALEGQWPAGTEAVHASAAHMATASAAPAGATPVATPAEVAQKGVYAKPGSAIAASQAKMGENSYYYSVGRNRGTPGAAGTQIEPPAPPPPKLVPKAVRERTVELPEQTIARYSMLDDDSCCKVHIPLAGATNLAEGAVSCAFRQRSFDLRITTDDKCAAAIMHPPCSDNVGCSCWRRG